MPIRKSKTKPSGTLKRLLDTKKHETRIVGPVERMLLGRERGIGRRQDVLHPSELAKSDHCPLADYYRLTWLEDGKELPKREALRMTTEVIFSEGHEYHRKWQEWVTDLGLLEGVWECPSCAHRWWDTAPRACSRCNHVGQDKYRYTNMIYREVPLKSQKHRISGHADGKAGAGLLEIKSIGEGTIRIEAPMLYKRHTKKVRVLDDEGVLIDGDSVTWVDMKALWDGIKRPFPSHIRQADTYMAVARLSGLEIDHMVFIYENKAKGGFKEFVVPFDQKRSDALLEVCLDIVWAVENRRPPSCPHEGCDNCRAYETKEDTTDGDATDTEDAGRGADRPLLGRSRAAGSGGTGPARPARRGLSRPS